MKLVQLLVKNLNGTISEEEIKLFNEWLRKSKRNKELYSRLAALYNKGIDVSELEVLDSEAAWNKVVQKYESSRSKKRRLFIFKPILRYAAVFIGVIALGYGYFQYVSSNNQSLEMDPDAITLQLDNGEIRVLSSDDTHAITDAQGNVLGQKEGSKLDYKDSKGEEMVYNKLTIPYGKRFEIALSDGTTVHLNAGSSLRYPVKFLNGKKRQVFLEGEAFFDVSEDKEHPFIVSAPGMDVTVLGTEFNVTAYPEDTFINTVLVEGSVGLSNANDEQSNTVVRLEPGYKAEWKISSGKAKVEQVDTEMYASWISGRLMLKNLSFKNIIKKLERHYNVNIENNFTELNSQVFTASFDVETIDEVLSTFSEYRKFNFEINNNTVTINKP